MLINLNNIWNEIITFGQKASDFIAKIIGSWVFIITQSIVLIIWIILNTVEGCYHWDKFPFILLNLFLSFQAALILPIILMSQNRQEDRDRRKAEHNYIVNKKTELKVEKIIEKLDTQQKMIEYIIKNIENQ